MRYANIRNMVDVHHAILSMNGYTMRITCFDNVMRTRAELDYLAAKWTTAVSDVTCERCLAIYAVNNLKVLAGSRK